MIFAVIAAAIRGVKQTPPVVSVRRLWYETKLKVIDREIQRTVNDRFAAGVAGDTSEAFAMFKHLETLRTERRQAYVALAKLPNPTDER